MAWLVILAAGLFETGFAVALIRRITSISPLTAIVAPNASSNPAQGLSSKARPPRRPMKKA
jgi:hypothetical protein